MRQLIPLAIRHEQMSADQIRHTRTMLETIVPGHRATWIKFGSSEEIADLFKWSAVLQGQTHQAGNDVVETDQFGGAVWTFEPEEDFCRLRIVMHAEVERSFPRNANFLCDVASTSRE